MTAPTDPTTPIGEAAAALDFAEEGTSCNQTSYKVGKRAFLYLGPGPKGRGFKAMFKLKASMGEAQQLAADQPERFEVGNTGWVTTRFTAEEPLPAAVWRGWLQESYGLSVPQASKTSKRS